MIRATVLPESHFPFIDALRGISILAVFLIHTFGVYSAAQLYNAPEMLVGNIIIANLASFAVPFFIFISGFSLRRSFAREPSLSRFYQKRAYRLIPAYLFFSFFYSIVVHRSSVGDAVYQLMTGSAHFHLWFVPLLVQCYLVFPLVQAMLRAALSRRMASVVVVGGLLMQIVWNLFTLGLSDGSLVAFGNMFFLSHIFYFILGIYCAFRVESNALLTSKTALRLLSIVPACLMALSLLTYIRVFESVTTHRLFIDLQFLRTLILPGYVLLIGIALYHIRSHRICKIVQQPLEVLGSHAYGIYLVHALYLSFCTYVLLLLRFTLHTLASNLIIALLSFIASYMTVVACSRVPYVRVLFGAPATPHNKR